MTEQSRKCIKKEIGKLLSDIWQIKSLAEQGVWSATLCHIGAVDINAL